MQSPNLHRLRKNDRTGDIARKVRKNIPRERERTRTYDRQLDDRLWRTISRDAPGHPLSRAARHLMKSLFFGDPTSGHPIRRRESRERPGRCQYKARSLRQTKPD